MICLDMQLQMRWKVFDNSDGSPTLTTTLEACQEDKSCFIVWPTRAHKLQVSYTFANRKRACIPKTLK